MENKQMLEEFLELVQIPVQSRSERQIADVRENRRQCR